jgi:hypothetical protein
MNKSHKIMLKVADIVRQRLAERQNDQQGQIQLPEQTWSQIERLMRQIALARKRDWHAAAKNLAERLLHEVNFLSNQLEAFHTHLRQQMELQKLPTNREVFQELVALEEEFDGVEIEPKTAEIRVTTDFIVLDDVQLGRFEIRLDWKACGAANPYRVIALDPNPPACDSHVTHPHVQNERLCEGDGHAAIQAALDQGRLGDFFQIVTQILSTYAQGSAYVELDQWYGEPCYDCGGMVLDDERIFCARCDRLICGDCSVYCEDCERDYCSSCTTSCEVCHGSFCQSCIDACSECRREICAGCLTENGLCEKCHAKRQQNDDDAGEHQEPADAQAGTQSVSGTQVQAVHTETCAAV